VNPSRSDIQRTDRLVEKREWNFGFSKYGILLRLLRDCKLLKHSAPLSLKKEKHHFQIILKL